MEGVEILYSELIQAHSDISILLMWILSVLTSAFVVTVFIAAIATSEPKLCIPGVLIGILVPLTWTATIRATNEKPYTEYTATIDDSVSFAEFNSRYKIVDRKGDLYIIVERDLDNTD